jgi:hypothetical protein
VVAADDAAGALVHDDRLTKPNRRRLAPSARLADLEIVRGLLASS